MLFEFRTGHQLLAPSASAPLAARAHARDIVQRFRKLSRSLFRWAYPGLLPPVLSLSLIHISEPTRLALI
eukprot:4534605-Alexandrium_andersonii.AAC.1